MFILNSSGFAYNADAIQDMDIKRPMITHFCRNGEKSILWGNLADDFKKQKIVYPNMTKYLPFYLDNDGMMTNQKCFIMIGENT